MTVSLFVSHEGIICLPHQGAVKDKSRITEKHSLFGWESIIPQEEGGKKEKDGASGRHMPP